MIKILNETERLETLQAHVAAVFESVFGGRPALLAAAPGRVNVIGEHIDYNGGLVLPAAIERWIVAAVRPRPDSEVVLYDARLEERVSFQTGHLVATAGRSWLNYVKGVLAGYARRGDPLSGFEACFYSTIPTGGGLSSSAALEAVMAMAIARLQNIAIPPLEMAKLCQTAEHEYVGVPCGLMDQAAVILSRAGHLLALDCETETAEFCPFADPDWSLMIINSGVAHELANSEYRNRRTSCRDAARLLGIQSLCQLDPSELQRALAHPALSEEMQRCVRHAVTENARSRAVIAALSTEDYLRVGKLLDASHESLRVDYRVSCEELDFIVQAAHTIEGVAGCRMTGGGFGGSAIALVRTAVAETAQHVMEKAYLARFGRIPSIFLTRPVAGASTCSVEN